MKKTVDAMGDACPIPVVKTKKVIEELKAQGGTVETFVDNEIAVQNLTKLGKSSGYSVLSEKKSNYNTKFHYIFQCQLPILTPLIITPELKITSNNI